MKTVTVRFDPSTRSQRELQASLGRVLRGIDNVATVEPVFPGDNSPDWKGNFVVKFAASDTAVLQALRTVPGVRVAYTPAARRSM
jgi:hypothetical protein